MKQIDSLSREADKLKRKEVEGVIARIKEAIDAYGLTAADLGLKGAKAKAAAAGKPTGRRTRSKSAKSDAPKFRDEAGNIWVGRGPRPQWLRDALAAGKQLQDFAV